MKNIPIKHILLNFVLILSMLMVSSAPAAAQSSTLAAAPASQVTAVSVVARVYYSDQADLNQLANSLDIWTVNQREGYFIAQLTPGQHDGLLAAGYRIEVDAEQTAKLNAPTAALDPRFYFFDDYVNNSNNLYMVDFLEQINASYPDLTELIDVGDAWQTNHGGHHRDMWVLRITNEDAAYGDIADKPPFFVYANTHAREVTTPEMAIRYIKYLLTGYDGEGGYGLDADATWLVNHNVVYVMVAANPDGRVPDEQEVYNDRRKNMNNTQCPSGDFGIDLNRNHSFFWNTGGSSGDPCNITYRGVSAASEPEVQTFEDYFATVIPDQNGPNGDFEIPPAAPITTTGIFISLHSFSDLVLWPWGHTSTPAPNGAGLQTIGRKFAFYNGYTPQQSINLYATSGTTDEYTYGKFGVPSYTFEIGDYSSDCGQFFPDYECMDGTDGASRNFWAENKPALLFAHKIARTPYITAYGPDAQNLLLTPGAVTAGEPVDLSAVIADNRMSGDPLQPVNAAEYFIDAPGVDGAGTSMNPADGAWGSASEAVTATLDTTGLSSGAHYVLVHGRNDDGLWGPFTAIFVYITEPGVTPVIEGYVRDASTNAPLQATISASQFQTTSDPDTGFYSLVVISGTYNLVASTPGHTTQTIPDVQAQDYQTIEQDFYLSPYCAVLSNDVEGGAQGWTGQTPWAITNESSHSATHSWTDSPGGNYSDGRNISLTSPVIDLTGYLGSNLNFWHTYQTESGWDFCYVEYSTNGGSTWSSPVATYDGSSGGWSQTNISIPALDNQANARIRFRFTSDTGTVSDGWHIDDILLIADSGPTCAAPIAPTAEFTSTSPIYLGEAIQFTNLVSGTTPLEYAWDFGDGLGTSTESDPSYVYSAAGTYTVTLTVSNSLGSDSISHSVLVIPVICAPLTDVQLAQITTGVIGVGEDVLMNANFEPVWATKPYTYTLTFGDGSGPLTASSSADPLVFTHTFATTGTFPVEISAWNCIITSTVSDLLAVNVFQVGLETSAPVTASTGLAGELVTYTLQVTNTGSTTDTYDIVVSNVWTTTLSSSQVTLDAGESATVIVTVQIPAAAAGGASDVATVTVTSQNDPAYTSEIEFITSAAAQAHYLLFLPTVTK